MRLLLIEDDIHLSMLERDGLIRAGFEADQVYTAEDALAALGTQTYDLVILDLNLPDKDGLVLLREIRNGSRNIPILILTARDELETRLKGLNGGADDYLLKPFAIEELTARVRALLRRPQESLGTMLKTGNIAFDVGTRAASVADIPFPLTRRELDLLEQLMRCAGQVLSRELIESRLYSFGSTGSANATEALVHRLRKKLAKANATVEIQTLRGIGYLLALSPA